MEAFLKDAVRRAAEWATNHCAEVQVNLVGSRAVGLDDADSDLDINVKIAVIDLITQCSPGNDDPETAFLRRLAQFFRRDTDVKKKGVKVIEQLTGIKTGRITLKSPDAEADVTLNGESLQHRDQLNALLNDEARTFIKDFKPLLRLLPNPAHGGYSTISQHSK